MIERPQAITISIGLFAASNAAAWVLVPEGNGLINIASGFLMGSIMLYAIWPFLAFQEKRLRNTDPEILARGFVIVLIGLSIMMLLIVIVPAILMWIRA